MSTRHVRSTEGARVVLAVSWLYHQEGRNEGRKCQLCDSVWTVQIDESGDCHVWRNALPMDSAILDWTGNNVVVECCKGIA